jgi:subtilisin family serine protease
MTMKTPSLYLAIATLYATSHLTVQAVVPNDPMFNQQWNMTKIGAPTAWGTTTGSTNIVVVVMDTGVDYTHPDIAPNMWRNPGETGFDTNGVDKATNGIDDDTNGYVDDVHGINVRLGTGDPMDLGTGATPPVYHGTGIAGIIGAAGNNGAGISGINWSVQIMAIRVGAMQPPALPQREVINHFVAAWNYVLDRSGAA